jgi:hypothetical protein
LCRSYDFLTPEVLDEEEIRLFENAAEWMRETMMYSPPLDYREIQRDALFTILLSGI